MSPTFPSIDERPDPESLTKGRGARETSYFKLQLRYEKTAVNGKSPAISIERRGQNQQSQVGSSTFLEIINRLTSTTGQKQDGSWRSHRLPVDVLYVILEHMDHDKVALATLCLVNRVFKEASESVLYRRIVMPLPAVSRVCMSLASDRLATLVRHFETSKRPGWKPRDARELLHMRTALRKMTGLRTLRIHFGGPLAWILDGCNFTELRSMLCNLSCDHYLAEFLRRQVQLTDVTLSSIHTLHFPCHIDQSCLPNLRQISAEPAWLSMLVPYRPVTNIDIWNFVDTDTRESDWLSQSSSAVTSLSVSESFLLSQGVACISSLVPQLRHLSIKCSTPDLFSEEETEKRQEFVTLLLRILAYFQSLVGFEVRFCGACPDEDTLLRQVVVDSSETSLDLRIFVMSFAWSSRESPIKVVWHRSPKEWKRHF